MPNLLRQFNRKARKEHTCDFCGLKIEVGETYEDQTCVYDGEIYQWKSHLSCEELTQKLKMFVDCWHDEGLTMDAFQEYITEFLQSRDIYLKSWTERIAKAKEMLCNAA